jgi:hypothetical protein
VVELNSRFFQGLASDSALIVAGIHSSEQSGVEVARWIAVKLAARAKPTRLGALVIPEVFPDEGRNARTVEWKTGSAAAFRDRVRGQAAYPARQFPPPGKPLSFIKDGVLVDVDGKPLLRDRNKVRMLPEIEYLIRCIEILKPTRIVSVHAKRPRTRDDLSAASDAGLIKMTAAELAAWDGRTAIAGVNFSGVFVDPRYSPTAACFKGDLEACKFNRDLDPAFPTRGTDKRFDSAITDDGKKDDALALATAKDKAFTTPELIAGNHVADVAPVVHYAKEPGTPSGFFSLGDWGPVDVDPTGGSPGSRRGAPVFTVEVLEDGESWSFADATQVMKADGSGPLKPPLTPEQRARNASPPPYPTPRRWTKDRSAQLQQYAEAIINEILDS